MDRKETNKERIIYLNKARSIQRLIEQKEIWKYIKVITKEQFLKLPLYKQKITRKLTKNYKKMLEKDSKKPVKIDERIDTIDYLGFIDWGSTFGWWQANCEEDEKHVIIKSAVFENSLKLKDYSVYTAKDNSYQLERSRMRLKYVEASVNKAKELEKEEKEKEKKKIRPITADSIIKTEEKEEEEKETVKPIKHKAEDLSKEFDMMSGMLDDIFKPTPRLKKIERVNSEESAKSTNTVDEVKGRLFPGEPIIGIDDDLNFFIKNL